MSMSFNLAKLDPVSLAAVLEDPELLEDVFLGERPKLPGAFKVKADLYSEDWRGMKEVSDACARLGARPGLMDAVDGAGGRTLDVDLTYGAAWVLTAELVAAMAERLTAEREALRATQLTDDEDPRLVYGYLLDEMIQFYGAAAQQGRAVVGGVT
jgi:hypothetical protein